MDAVGALVRLGGIGTAERIVALSSRKRLRTAVRRGQVLRRSRDRYVLATADAAVAAAAELHGVVSHLSAAAYWGWEVKLPPERPHVAVPRGRNVHPSAQAGVCVHWLRLRADEVVGFATSALRTVIDCARDLPFDEALAVADSALRHGEVTRDELRSAASRLRGPGAARVRRVARHADGRAANPFESVLRAIALQIGLEVLPQQPVDLGDRVVHPDLTDRARRLVVEGDSWTWHADKTAHERDCARYNALVVAGWLVLRFTWQQVMLSPAYVRAVLRAFVSGPPGRPQVRRAA